jgi:hypothetical protein
VTTTYDFGWSATNYAGAQTGEIGGRFACSSRYRAYYARALASVNRFGIRNIQRGGGDTEFYLDALRYTSAPGDVGPSTRC